MQVETKKMVLVPGTRDEKASGTFSGSIIRVAVGIPDKADSSFTSSKLWRDNVGAP